jgi:superfamily II DNA or RNA helicase
MPIPKKTKYRSFSEAREFIRGLKFQNRDDFLSWARSDLKPADIPASPSRVYLGEWVDWADWVGSNKPSKRNRSYLTFKDAKKFVHSLKFFNRDQFVQWVKSPQRPLDIPSDPRGVYQGEWIGWGDWLGTGFVATTSRQYKSYEEAKNYIQKLNLKTKDEFTAWAKSPKKPDDIPSNPAAVYGNDWKGVGDWLGTGSLAPKDKKFRSFEDARQFVRTLGIKNRDGWRLWVDSLEKPADIPSDPGSTYSDEWLGWGDWLGTGTIATQQRKYKSFVDARKFIRSIHLKDKESFIAWSKKFGSEHIDIPANPPYVYSNEWISWGDWVGNYSQWSQKALIGFIKSLYPILSRLEPSELYAILRNNNCLNAIEELGEDSPLKQLINSTLHGDMENAENLYLKIQELEIGSEAEDEVITSSTDLPIDALPLAEDYIPDQDDVEELPELSTAQILDNLDHLETVLGVSDNETVEFLMNKAVGRMWSHVLRSPVPDQEINLIISHKCSGYSLLVKERFLEQYEGARGLEIPEGYAFSKNGEILKPNLMQRLAAYRVLKDSRIGNWSGTGAGKTLGAILASRVIGAKLTIIIGLNNTILGLDTGWAGDIKNAFPLSNILIKEKKDIAFSKTQPNYLLLNYETFQLDNSKDVVDKILENHQVDLIVLDEVHSAKSRDQVESRRRVVINYLLQKAAELNPELRVLGMSATPVLNSLDEAVSLLEMIKGIEYPDLGTSAKLSNALAIHEQLVINGIRYVPNYSIELKEVPIEIVDNAVAEDLKKIGKGQIAQVEITLLGSKLSTIISLCKPGTIIFSHYVESIFDELSDAVKAAGFKVARFNGDDKTGIELFKQGKVDILIGSSALGTGVDGLQYVCNRMIIVCLPWTSAGYEQLIGRIYRQGSKFNEVEVFIPQVVLSNNGESWSWDKQRHARIKYKKTLADAAVDGVVPEANLASPNLMLAESKRALDDWLSRLESGEIREVPRRALKVPLPKDAVESAIHRYGDFSLMNQRFNTSKSSTSHERLAKDPEEFYLYHSLYREARQTWSEIPFEVIAEQINKRPDWVVGDFGCGEALLSKSVRNKVYSFDHVAINPSVIACDMSDTGLDGEILDVAVFSLSLMGVNWQDYLKEAFRMLRPGGLLKISESASGWDKDNFIELKKGIETAGFQLLGDAKLSSKFVYFDAAKPL